MDKQASKVVRKMRRKVGVWRMSYWVPASRTITAASTWYYFGWFAVRIRR